MLPIHDIPDGSFLTDSSDPDNTRQCPEDDRINVRGTLLGKPVSYLFGKGIKHLQMLTFI